MVGFVFAIAMLAMIVWRLNDLGLSRYLALPVALTYIVISAEYLFFHGVPLIPRAFTAFLGIYSGVILLIIMIPTRRPTARAR